VAIRCAPADSDAATTRNEPGARTSMSMPATKGVSSVAGLHLTVAPAGNEVRYRIREQLANIDLPNDAIGRTGEITGGIGVTTDGRIIPAESKFTINVAKLTSDRSMRDNYVRRRLLETDQFPTVEFTPTSMRGLPKTLPTTGAHTFEMLGNLTVHGITKPTWWSVTAELKNGQVTGSASTLFTFSDFNLPQPRVPVVLSVNDTIRLEYDFALIPKS
ncbi:MAG: YceI family protein, partial [Gemmatimonadales bacterium]